MKIQLLSCDAPRPDRRAITKMFEELDMNSDSSLASEFTNNLLDGSSVDIEVSDKSVSSAYRTLRKLQIDYEIID